MLQAQVIYFPTYLGHICVRIFDPENLAQTRFFDFGAYHDYAKDCQCYSEAPIHINLPPIDTNWQQFLVDCLATPYSGRPYDDRMHYSLLNNNCAHATQQILHLAGYIEKKPPLTFALTPNAVAEQASAIARIEKEKQRQALVDAVIKNTNGMVDNIKKIISLTQDEIKHQSKIKRNPKYKSNDRKLLSQIEFDGSMMSIKRLLDASEKVNRETAIQLQRCISILPPQSYLKLTLDRLEVKAGRLFKRGYQRDADFARNLVTTLREQIRYLNAKHITAEKFEKNCLVAIEKAAPALQKHRGYGPLLGNLVLAVAGMGILYLVAAAINKKVTGNFLFFKETQSGKLLQEAKKDVHRLKK
jgi:hypothetical protein